MKKKSTIFVVVGIVLLGFSLILILSNTPYSLVIAGVVLAPGAIFLFEGLTRTTHTKIKNREAALSMLEQMIESAKNEIQIIAGTLDSHAYVERRKVREMIEEKVRAGVNVEIVCTEDPDPRSLESYGSLLSNPRFNIFKTNENVPFHGAQVDGRIVRIERLHSPNAKERSNAVFKRPGLAMNAFTSRFNKCRQNSIALQPKA